VEPSLPRVIRVTVRDALGRLHRRRGRLQPFEVGRPRALVGLFDVELDLLALL
jgi:hypothetical protein